jgi:hypothetical protein
MQACSASASHRFQYFQIIAHDVESLRVLACRPRAGVAANHGLLNTSVFEQDAQGTQCTSVFVLYK